MLAPMGPEKWDEMFGLYKALRDEMSRNNRSGRVQNPHCYVPIGLQYNRYKNKLSLVGLGGAAHELLYANAPDEGRKEKIAQEYSRRFLHSQDALKRIRGEEDKEDRVIRLVKIDLKNEPAPYGFTAESASTYDWKFDFKEMESHLHRIIKHEQQSHTYNGSPAKMFWVNGREFAPEADND